MIELLEKLLAYLKKRKVDQQLGSVRSPEWPRVRRGYIKHFPACAICGTKKNCEVHHKTPVHKDQTNELDPDNLITLCSDHHLTFGHLHSYFSWNEDLREDVEIWRDKIETRP